LLEGEQLFVAQIGLIFGGDVVGVLRHVGSLV
jgi:hypothetical protein